MTSTLYLRIGLQFRRFLLEFLIIIAKTPEGALVSIARSLNKGREHLAPQAQKAHAGAAYFKPGCGFADVGGGLALDDLLAV